MGNGCCAFDLGQGERGQVDAHLVTGDTPYVNIVVIAVNGEAITGQAISVSGGEV